MTNVTKPSTMQIFDSEVAALISKSQNIDTMAALKLFLESETHEMLLDDDLKLWHFSALAIFDMWENEQANGDPRTSLYLMSDEIA